MINNQTLLELFTTYKMAELEKALKENTREELQRASGTNKSDAAIIKTLVKTAGKNTYNTAFTKCHPFTISGVDYFGFTDGHYILASELTFDYDIAADHELFKMEKFFDGMQEKRFSLDVQELKVFCKDKINKSKNYMYTVMTPEGFYIAFNAKYMLDCLLFAGVDYFLYNDKNVYNCIKTPLLIENKENNKLCLCLPVNVQNGAGALEYMEKWRKNEL